ncbi:MAG TPA: flavodoxin family protein, partial [Dehalococcoidia bacterium]|nr:flavodoxin family protein [Dehalococcoidia bacterium]
GAATELVQMSDYVVNACRDCLPWVCLKNLKCTYEDENFEYLSQKLLDCGGLVLGSPVYWWDTSAMVRYFFLKMFRIFAMSGKLRGLPAFGIAIAGGTGNGMTIGLRPLYHFFQIMHIRALDPVPATRFDLNHAIDRAREQGQQIAGMVQERVPFSSWEECLLWYDNLPYIGDSRADERRLLAAITAEAVPEERKQDIEGNLARADILAASGRSVDSMKEITKIVNSCSKILSE